MRHLVAILALCLVATGLLSQIGGQAVVGGKTVAGGGTAVNITLNQFGGAGGTGGAGYVSGVLSMSSAFATVAPGDLIVVGCSYSGVNDFTLATDTAGDTFVKDKEDTNANLAVYHVLSTAGGSSFNAHCNVLADGAGSMIVADFSPSGRTLDTSALTNDTTSVGPPSVTITAAQSGELTVNVCQNQVTVVQTAGANYVMVGNFPAAGTGTAFPIAMEYRASTPSGSGTAAFGQTTSSSAWADIAVNFK